MDQTLLDIDFDGMMREYLKRLSARFPEVQPAEAFQRQLLASTEVMMANADSARTLLEVFAADFFPAVNLPQSAMARFDAFYREEYPKLAHWGRPMPHARELIEAALSRGLRVVVATAPVFPQIAVRERLRWAGLHDIPFHLITAADAMCFSKPYPRYYREIAERLGVPPDRCMMVGDNPAMDGTAAQVGMQVVIVGSGRAPASPGGISDRVQTNGAANRGHKVVPEAPAHVATLRDLHDTLRADGVL